MDDQNTSDNDRDRWERFLSSEEMRKDFISISIYTLSFELLKSSVKDRVKQFYQDFARNMGKYKEEIRVDTKHEVPDCLNWLLEVNAIEKQDVSTYKSAVEYRNKIVHEFGAIIGENILPELSQHFEDVFKLLEKIEKWWLVNYEIPANPALEGQDIDIDNAVPGITSQLGILYDIVLGTPEEANKYKNILNREIM